MTRILILSLLSGLLCLNGCSYQPASPPVAGKKAVKAKPQYPYVINLGRPNDFTTVYLATKSIQRKGNFVQAWQFAVHDYPVPLGNLGTALSSEALVSFNCIQKTQALLQSRTFADASGKKQIGEAASFPDKPESYNPIKPKSVAARALSVVCSSAPRRSQK